MGNSTTWWEVITTRLLTNFKTRVFLSSDLFLSTKLAPSFVLFYVKGKYVVEENLCRISNRNIPFISLSEPNEMYVVFVIVWAKI